MFRTEISIHPSAAKISPGQRAVALGSCFATMIGDKLAANKFDVTTNPAGIIYNPASLHYILNLALDQALPDENRTCKLHGRYVHFDFHSEVSGADLPGLMSQISKRLDCLRKAILAADWLFITYGTAVVHRFEGKIAANCHKQPSGIFTKNMESLDHLRQAAAFTRLLEVNPRLQIVLTVSPVRHIKDTLQVNSLSKSLLRVLAADMENTHSNISYFPSYEIMTDDLRDYRYYQRDLIHPSDVAEDYIWNKFSEVYFSTSTRKLLEEWNLVRRNLAHRPFNPQSDDHQKFLQKTLDRLENLSAHLSLEDEIVRIKSQLNNE